MPPLISFVVAGSTDADPLLGPELEEAEVVHALEEATGEYVWLLTGPLQPGAIADVAERLRATAPDVLVADAGAHKRVLERVARDGVVTLEQRPGLAGSAFHLGDKVLRHEFTRGLGVADADLAWPALLTAERIVAAPGARCATGPDAPGRTTRPCSRSSTRTRSCRRRAAGSSPRRCCGTSWPSCARCPPAERAARFAALTELWRRHRRGLARRAAGARLVAPRVPPPLPGAGGLRARPVARSTRVKRRARSAPPARARRRLERHYRARR